MKGILQNWDTIRVIRVIIGVSMIGQGVASSQSALWLMGTLFTGMALLNVGCFGSANCSVPQKSNTTQITDAQDVTFEEVTVKETK